MSGRQIPDGRRRTEDEWNESVMVPSKTYQNEFRVG